MGNLFLLYIVLTMCLLIGSELTTSLQVACEMYDFQEPCLIFWKIINCVQATVFLLLFSSK